MIAVPEDFEVQPIDPDDPSAVDPATCGTCGLSWDDGVSTGWTPAPSGRCPFEYFHEEESERVVALSPPLDAIRAVVNYNWADEEADYGEMVRMGEIEAGDPGHVYTSLTRIQEWLEAVELQEGVTSA